jgi:nitroreductase
MTRLEKMKTMTSTNHRETIHPVDPLFLERWSPRAYSGEPLPERDLMTVLEAAHWAPSASNNQPWRFVYGIKGTPAFDGLLSILNASNQRWARQAGALVFVISQSHTEATAEREARPIPTHSFDAGAAWMALALQAHLLGLHAHGMAGLDYDRARQELDVPEGYKVEMALTVGRAGRVEDLPEDLQPREKPSQRKPLAAVIGEGRFHA